MNYRATQYGWGIFLPIVIIAWVVAIVFAIQGQWLGASLLGIVPLLGFFLFGKLVVSVDRDAVRLRFGFLGLIRRSIALERVAGARAVRNKWYYGWGIRLTPYGWLWNIQGLDAVQLHYNDGGNTRIGTDEPEKLVRAVERAVQSD